MRSRVAAIVAAEQRLRLCGCAAETCGLEEGSCYRVGWYEDYGRGTTASGQQLQRFNSFSFILHLQHFKGSEQVLNDKSCTLEPVMSSFVLFFFSPPSCSSFNEQR